METDPTIGACSHEQLRQISTMTVETFWALVDGRYVPDADAKVLGEDTDEVACAVCGDNVGLGHLGGHVE